MEASYSCPHTVTLAEGVNPGVLHSTGKKQHDHQELPNSSLTTATRSSPALPGGSVQRKQNLSLWRQDCFCSREGRTNHRRYIWSSKPLSLAPFFATSRVSRMHICNPPALLTQGGPSEFFLGVVNSFQESGISSFSNYLVTKSVLAMLGKSDHEIWPQFLLLCDLR